MGMHDRDWYREEVRKKREEAAPENQAPRFHGQYEPVTERRFQGYFRGNKPHHRVRTPWLLMIFPWFILLLLAKFLLFDQERPSGVRTALPAWKAAHGWLERWFSYTPAHPLQPVQPTHYAPPPPPGSGPVHQKQNTGAGNPSLIVPAPERRLHAFAINADRQGHYRTAGWINGRPVHFLVDTGATNLSVPTRLAHQLGLTSMNTHLTTTASDSYAVNGTTVDELVLGPFRLQGIDADLNPRAQNDEILLGMSALKYFEMVQKQGVLTLSANLVPPPAQAAQAIPESIRSLPDTLEFKHSVRECLGADKRIDQRVLNFVQGR